MITLLETNISHMGQRKIIFKYALSGGYVNSLEGTLLETNISPSQSALLSLFPFGGMCDRSLEGIQQAPLKHETGKS